MRFKGGGGERIVVLLPGLCSRELIYLNNWMQNLAQILILCNTVLSSTITITPLNQILSNKNFKCESYKLKHNNVDNLNVDFH